MDQEMEFKRSIAEAERLAEAALDPSTREQFLKIAEGWRTLLRNLRRRKGSENLE